MISKIIILYAYMNLSDLIIYRKKDALFKALAAGHNPNQFDQYGTTPLVNAVILNDVDILNALIQHGASLEMKDVRGQTPLFWAADDNKRMIARALLNAGANPNAFNVEGQPLLVFPMMRNHHEMKDLLIAQGADITFAQDYIHAKLIGHRYELKGDVSIPNVPEKLMVGMSFEGFIPAFSIKGVQSSLKQLLNHYGGRALSDYFPYVSPIIEALEVAHALRLLRYRGISDEERHTRSKVLFNQHDFMIIPVTFEGHAITFVKMGAFFAHCDRGERSQTHDAVTLYQATYPERLNDKLYHHLLFKRHTRQFINQELHQHLGLRAIGSIPTTSQIAGNCSWANVEASIPTLLYMLMQSDNPNIASSTIQEAAIAFYQAWKDWDKDVALSLCLNDMKDKTKARRLSKANILVEILSQGLSTEVGQDVARAQRIVPILMQDEYKVLIQELVQLYCRDLTNPDAKRLALLLKHADVDYRLLL